ncbi:RNA polymerase sigma factor [Paenibacillus koleovorans]|uniref:RNA polymerase sigma factor n=1 Tax=Paenibacillus koleovorans TaxID=121608 RepID=UPI000FDBC3FB|nr:RNA polymerase sigma factor [Paenibacillus koleovorans]
MEEHYLRGLTHTDDPGTLLRDLMQTYGNEVWSYAYVLTGQREAADDLSQDVFLSAYRNLAGFRGDSSVRTWLLRITRNACFNFRRASFFRRTVLHAWIASKERHRSAEDEALQRMELQQVWASVMALSPKLREALVLEAHYQLSYREIAQLLGISEGTVKSRIHRARAKLKANTATDDEEGMRS